MLPRLLAWALLLLIALPLIVVSSIYLGLQTAPGRSLLVKVIESSVSEPDGLKLEIGRLEGPLPQRIELRDVELRDPAGQLFAVDRVLLTWRPLSLLQRHLEVTALQADKVQLHRLPEGAEEEPAKEDSSPPLRLALPEVPLSVTLERLDVEELILSESLAGSPARLAIDGAARLERSGALDARLAIERIDDRAGNLDAELALAAGGEHLTARIKGSESADGLLAELLDLPGRPPIQILLDGDGPPEGWVAHLTAEAEETAQLMAELRLDALQPLKLSIEGEAHAQALLPEELQPLLSESLSFSANLQQKAEGGLDLRDLHLSTALAELQGKGSLQADGETVEAELAIAVADGQPLASLTAPITFAQARIDLKVAGRLSAPTADLKAELHRFSGPEAQLQLVTLTGHLNSLVPLNEADASVALDLSLEGKGLHLEDEGLLRALPGDPRLVAKAVYRPKQQYLTLEQVEASLAELLVQLSGEVALPEDAEQQLLPVGHLVLKADHGNLSSLAALTDSDLSGRLHVDADVTLHDDGTIDGDLKALADRLHLGIPAADAMLGERPALVAKLRRSQGDQIHLEEFHLDTAISVLTAEALIAPDYSKIDAAYRLAISALEPLGDALQQPLGGSLQLEGTAVGSLLAPHIRANLTGEALSLPGDPLQRLTAELDVDFADPGPLGSLLLEGSEGRYGPLHAEAVFAKAKDFIFLEPFSFNLGDAANIKGELQWPLNGEAGSGTFQGEISQLDALAALVGVQAAGNVSFEAELSPREGQQALEASAEIRQFRFGPASDPALQLAQLDLRAHLNDLLGSPRIEAELAANRLSAGELALSSTRLRASGELSAIAASLDAQGTLKDEPLQLQSDATLALEGERSAVTLASLALDWAHEELRLLRPAQVVLTPDHRALQGLRLALLGGRLEADVEQRGEGLEGTLQLSALPLARLAALAKAEDVEGVLSASMTLSGSMAAPQAQLRLEADDLAFWQEAELTSRPSMNFRGEASLNQGSLLVNAGLTGFADTPLSLRAQIPVRASLDPFVMELLTSRALDANVHWEGDLAPIVALLPTDAIRLTGEGLVDLQVAGTLDDPQLSGEVVIKRGRYENYTSGTLLAPMELVIRGADRRLTLERLEASDGGEGKIEGSGHLTWLGTDGLESDLHVRFDKMLIAQRDDVTARISGDIDVAGNLFKNALISGRLTNDFVEVRLVDALPPSVAEIDVIEVRDGVPASEEEELSSEPPAPSPITLNVEIDLPRRVFVRGRGLESEWRGHFLINGRVNNPQISGEITPARGSFTIVGKTFVLEEGSIRLPPGAPGLDPELDLRAVYNTTNFRALVLITGSASHPQVELSSEPELPNDEILSRVLFNKTSANLTVLEAVELADAAATLASGGTGVTGLMRRALGVDQFGFRPGATEDDPGSLAVGTYLGEGVYVGFEQGMRPGSTGVTVEIDITDRIKAHSDVTADGQSRTGIRWQMDY